MSHPPYGKLVPPMISSSGGLHSWAEVVRDIVETMGQEKGETAIELIHDESKSKSYPQSGDTGVRGRVLRRRLDKLAFTTN